MNGFGNKYEELNAFVTNVREQLRTGHINHREARKLLEVIYEEYRKLEEEENRKEVHELNARLLAKWMLS
ncbi:hypothetical protein [Ascidiimonas aurantiaca]|uniref:hypothetical protein n=1 Tax=Ascidiimonas aurantiaca TaxID=1685432 RepID=UPI0030EB7506